MEQEEKMKWSYHWKNFIDMNKLIPYPIQFANCERIFANDEVYIFDEVGSGKTISSGLMALHYLYNHKKETVLVITTPTLAREEKDGTPGTFLKEWYDKLPFRELKLDKEHGRIQIVNNHYSNLKETNLKEHYGLVIIDEAHLFLSEDETLRYNNLKKNVHADKVVFMTATPIKEWHIDLRKYIELAERITGKPSKKREWIQEISTMGKLGYRDIICSIFDETYPVTRYFKDTIRALNREDTKVNTRRLLPLEWNPEEGESRDVCMLRNINTILDSGEKNASKIADRFVIFVRLVKDEANKLGEELFGKNGFVNFDREPKGKKTYKVITGVNGHELSRYSGYDELPTVLILTYQIAEQGINLPGFNYVVNYHISSFPSSLEQRFGRIDRMGKEEYQESKDIHICYLAEEEYRNWDTNTYNYHLAIDTYIHYLIPYLPSRNTILTEEVITKHLDMSVGITKYREKIKEMVKQQEQMEALQDYYIQRFNGVEEPICQCDKELLEFVTEHFYNSDLEADQCILYPENIRLLKEAILKKLSTTTVNAGSKEKVGLLKEVIRKAGNDIFYSTTEKWNEKDMQTMKPIEDCAEMIRSSENYKKYKDRFMLEIKKPLLFSYIRCFFNQYFEERFMENDFNHIFPYNGYRSIFEEILNVLWKKDVCSIEERADIEAFFLQTENNRQNREYFIQSLPFFKMCADIDRLLWRQVGAKSNTPVMWDRQMDNPFAIVFSNMVPIRMYGLSETFQNWYRQNSGRNETYNTVWNHLKLRKNEQGKVEAGCFLKLAYYFLRKENYCSCDKYREFDIWMRKLFEDYERCDVDNKDAIIEHIYIKKCQDIGRCGMKPSMFHRTIYTTNGAKRKYCKFIFDSMSETVDGMDKICPDDLWTACILAEMRADRFTRFHVYNMSEIFPFKIPEFLQSQKYFEIGQGYMKRYMKICNLPQAYFTKGGGYN